MVIEKEQRDKYGNLKCPHLGCKHIIKAMTGLQELQKMQAHFASKHNKRINMNDALEIRHLTGG